MKLTLCGAALALFALPAWAQSTDAKDAAQPKIDRIEIVDFGVYTLDETVTSTNADGITHRDTTNVRLAEQTRTLKVQFGIHFGFRYNIIGSPADALVEVRSVLIYPPGGLHNPDVDHPIYSAEFHSRRKIGEQNVYQGITIGHQWGMVPGPWTIELWQGDTKLTSQTFTLVQ
ncbi:MAG TPA: DUF3859 domain-containing protein [Terracidiphilus sp.]|nr:DUF3859 domain-containing protein [Terracidiphilus sp.]